MCDSRNPPSLLPNARIAAAPNRASTDPKPRSPLPSMGCISRAASTREGRLLREAEYRGWGSATMAADAVTAAVVVDVVDAVDDVADDEEEKRRRRDRVKKMWWGLVGRVKVWTRDN